jgi:hypothetical protein
MHALGVAAALTGGVFVYDGQEFEGCAREAMVEWMSREDVEVYTEYTWIGGPSGLERIPQGKTTDCRMVERYGFRVVDMWYHDQEAIFCYIVLTFRRMCKTSLRIKVARLN